ncbi:MAG: hypothetical protein ACKV2T_24170 [Kofleriaceae bacterium]
MRIPMAMTLLALPACDAGCGGGGTAFSARMVVGVEPQTIAREDLSAGASALVIRSHGEAVFPLVSSSPEISTEISVQSEFRLADVQQSANTLYDGEARTGVMGVHVPLRTFEPGDFDPNLALYTYDHDISRRPITDTWRGSFEVELRSGETGTRVKIDVAPFMNPCGDNFAGPTPAEYPPNARVDVAINSTATCLDGTACLARGTLLDRDVRSITVGPFVISTRVQAWCSEYAGY